LPAERREYHAAYAAAFAARGDAPPARLAVHHAESGCLPEALMAWRMEMRWRERPAHQGAGVDGGLAPERQLMQSSPAPVRWWSPPTTWVSSTGRCWRSSRRVRCTP
jgi:hypothetical protein